MFTCVHCGRRYTPGKKATTFVRRAFIEHQLMCRNRTPMERRIANKKDEMRWMLHKPAYPIKNNWNHPGLKSIFEKEAK